jgi:hypothetical protein
MNNVPNPRIRPTALVASEVVLKATTRQPRNAHTAPATDTGSRSSSQSTHLLLVLDTLASCASLIIFPNGGAEGTYTADQGVHPHELIGAS